MAMIFGFTCLSCGEPFRLATPDAKLPAHPAKRTPGVPCTGSGQRGYPLPVESDTP